MVFLPNLLAFTLKIALKFILIFSIAQSFSQPIRFFQGTYQEMMETAERTNKYVFLDFYTTWCRPCAMMEQVAFVDERLGAFMNEYYVSYRVDAEKQPELKELYHVPTYPFWLLMNPQGKILFVFDGYADGEFILHHAKQTIGYSDTKQAYLKQADDPARLSAYLQTLGYALKDSAERETERFLYRLPPETWRLSPYWELVRQYVYHISSPVYLQIAENAADWQRTQPEIKDYLLDCLQKAKNELFKSMNVDEFDTFKQTYTGVMLNTKEWKYSPEACKLSLDAEFALKGRKEQQYLEHVSALLDKDLRKVADKCAGYSVEAAKNFRSENCLNKAELWAQWAVENDAQSSGAYYALAFVKFKRGDKANALRWAEKAKTYALTPAELGAAEDLLQKIKNRN